MSGRDLSPLLSGEIDRVYSDEDAVGYELTAHAALFQGDYKLVVNQAPKGDGQWYLYDIGKDPGETNDLKGQMPGHFQSMLSANERYKRENGVLPMPRGYSQMGQLVANSIEKRYGSGIIVSGLTVLVLLPFMVANRMRRTRRTSD